LAEVVQRFLVSLRHGNAGQPRKSMTPPKVVSSCSLCRLQWSWRVAKKNHYEVSDTTLVTHGAWHGCSADWCWNPPEPATAIKLCVAGSTVVPCSLVNDTALWEFEKWPSTGNPIVGDLFACRRWSNKLECLGAMAAADPNFESIVLGLGDEPGKCQESCRAEASRSSQCLSLAGFTMIAGWPRDIVDRRTIYAHNRPDTGRSCPRPVVPCH
jgi:hypothetical protein